MDHDEWQEAISAEADGELDPSESARLDEHLAGCAACRRRLAELVAARRRLRLHSSPTAQHLVPAIVEERGRQHARELESAAHARATLLRRCTAAAVATAAVVAGLVAITSGGTTAPRPLTPSQGADALIAARDRTFDRADIEVPTGTTVEWRNAGTHVHHLVRELGGVTIGEDLPPGRTESATFDRSGTFSYYCTIHPEMQGTVTVDA
jgi:plastocyanin